MDFRRLLPEIRWQSRLSPVSGTGSPDWFFAPVHPSQGIPGQSRDSIRNSRIPAGFAGITDTVPGFDPGFDRVSMARSKDPRRAAPRYRPPAFGRGSAAPNGPD